VQRAERRSELPLTNGDLSRLEKAIAREMNRVRMNPSAYVNLLEDRRKYYKGNLRQIPGEISLITNEGVRAVDEAINFLKLTKPLQPFTLSKGMSLAAKDRVKDRGLKGGFGHVGSDGSLPWDRISRYGFWKNLAAESISYGQQTAEKVMMQLIVDDGVRDRAHRFNLFKPELQVTGVACGPHKQYEIVCVITYAGGYIERR